MGSNGQENKGKKKRGVPRVHNNNKKTLMWYLYQYRHHYHRHHKFAEISSIINNGLIFVNV